jgi:hypothetical protein
MPDERGRDAGRIARTQPEHEQERQGEKGRERDKD